MSVCHIHEQPEEESTYLGADTTFRDRNILEPQPTFMEILIAQGGLDLPVFTTNFNPTAKSVLPSIEFGKIDRSKYSGKLSTVAVN